MLVHVYVNILKQSTLNIILLTHSCTLSLTHCPQHTHTHMQDPHISTPPRRERNILNDAPIPATPPYYYTEAQGVY